MSTTSLDKFIENIFQSVTIKQANNEEFFYWPSSDVHCWENLNKTINTPERLLTHVKNRRVVIQAGGNAGFYIQQYAKEFERVYTFEPEPINFFCLNANTINFPNVVKFQACVGYTNKLVAIEHHPADFGGIHVFEKSHQYSHEQLLKPTMIPVMRIDDLALDACDLIQLDVEGYEYYALLGALETINKFKPIVCLEQAWSEKYYSISYEETEKILLDLGYSQIDSFESDRVYQYTK